MNFWVFLTFLHVVVSSDDSEGVIVDTAFGYIRGETLPTSKGISVDYFKGVPFAEKPQRLQKSRLVKRWTNVKDTRTYPPKCLTNIRPLNASNEFSEDCLYLNIIRPSGTTSNSSLPVVVFIHGGGFQEGFGNDAPCEAFGERFVTQGMIVVTIQYRLAIFGFLSLGCEDPRVPCNLGLWDMLTAFQFINSTIERFGGCAQNMTAWGHSAGSMAVGLHSLSPISSKFFSKYIEMSASAWSLSRYKSQNKLQSTKILQDLKCNMTNGETIRECLEAASLDDIYTVQIDTHLWPEFGDALLPDIPEKLVKNTKDQKVMTGFMTLESLYFMRWSAFTHSPPEFPLPAYLKSSPEIFPFIRRSTVEEYINSTVANEYGIDSTSAYTATIDYYLASNTSDTDYPYFMRQRSKLDSNKDFDIPILREVRNRMEQSSSSSVFLYYFPYFNPSEFDTNFPVEATYHCQEFPYIWGIYKDNYYELDENDYKISKFFIEAIVNFIKTGNPSSSNFTWPLIDSSTTHTVIQPEPTIEKHLFDSDYNFWDLMAIRFQFDLITGLPTEIFDTTTAGSATVSVLITFIISSLFIA